MNRQMFVGLIGGFILGYCVFYFYRRHRLPKQAYNNYKFVMIFRTDTKVGKGETAEYCSEVTLKCYRRAMERTPQFVEEWLKKSQPKITVKLEKDYEKEAIVLKEKAENLGLVAVALRGKNGLTVVGIGPGPQELINDVTGHLKLLG